MTMERIYKGAISECIIVFFAYVLVVDSVLNRSASFSRLAEWLSYSLLSGWLNQ
jgi:hypothetical protein